MANRAYVLLLVIAGLTEWSCSKKQKAEDGDPGGRGSALAMCKTVPHRNGATGCQAEVERRYDECNGPFMRKETSASAFAACLGFDSKPDPGPSTVTVLGQCEQSAIVAKFSAAIAKDKPWGGGDLGAVRGEVKYIATTPTLTTADVVSLRLEEADGFRSVSLQMSPEAAQRFKVATGENVGETMVIKVNGETIGAKIASAIPGPKLMIAVEGIELADVCREK